MKSKKPSSPPRRRFRSTRVPTRPTVAEIDFRALLDNLQAIRHVVGRNVEIMAVVKANAYGHGLVEVSKFLEKQGVRYFGVAYVEEGVTLREAGIKRPIHVFTLPTKEQASLCFDMRLEPTVCTEEEISHLSAVGRHRRATIPVHLKIETGMNRLGVRPENLDRLLNSLGPTSRVEIKGVFTHFATADESNKDYTRRQLQNFQRGLEIVRKAGIEPSHVHCANSASILDLPESYFSMVRPGISLYGYYPSHTTSESAQVHPVMTLKSVVSMVKWIEPGETVSYGRRFTAARRTRIASIPLGYADGLTRLLTGKVSVLIGGVSHPVAGTICMDQIMADVGTADIAPGDEVVVIGRQGGRSQDAWTLADSLKTIPYEILCAVAARVPRIYRRP